MNRVEKNGKKYEMGVNGEVVDLIKGKGFVIKVGDGSVILTEAKPENKKVLKGSDIINGGHLKIGDILK